MKKKAFLKGAAVIAAGGFLSKLVGAIYKIPLTNLIGGYGLGLYQMAYPIYCLLLTVSATGIPSSIACLTAERISRGEREEPLVKTSLKLFCAIGLVGTLLMAVLAPLLSAAQSERGLVGGYFALAPSVVLVSAISVFRGVFQGRANMLPTAISEIVEQLVKASLGLVFAWRYHGDIYKAVTLLLLAVSVSEAVALVYIIVAYFRAKKGEKSQKDGGRVGLKTVLTLSVPVTLSSSLFPLSSLVDSVLVVRLLGGYAENAVSLYGLFAGAATTIVGLPSSVCYGLAAASIPSVAAARGTGDTAELKKRVWYALMITLVISTVFAVGTYAFAGFAVDVVFRGLSASDRALVAEMVRGLSIGVVFLCGTQTLSACLTAQKKPKHSFYSAAVAIAVKTLITVVLVSNPRFSVFGAVIASNACYFLDFLCNLLYNGKVLKEQSEGNDDDNGSGSGRRKRRFNFKRQASDLGGSASGQADRMPYGEHAILPKRGRTRRGAPNAR